MTLPAGWQLLPLGAVAEINPRRPPSLSSMPDDTPVTFVPMAAVDEFSGAIEAPDARPFAEVRSGFTWFRENDVIFAKITPCMQNGKSAVARGLQGGVGFGSTEFHVLRAGDRVLPDWIWYFVREASFREEAKQNFKGTAGQQRVPTEWLAGKKIPIPPLEEQRRIVARIREATARVDEVRRLRAETAREADAVEAALVADLLASLDDDVAEVPLGHVLIRTQYGTSQKASLAGAGVPVYRMGNIQRGRLIHEDMKYVELPEAETRKYALQPGDILINRTNSLELVGKAACVADVPAGAVFASYLVRLIVDRQKAVPEFVSFVINSRIGRDYVLRTARRAIGMVNINSDEIGKMPVPLPKLEVQEAMVAKFIEVRQACDALRSELSSEQVEALPSSILRKAFAGEL